MPAIYRGSGLPERAAGTPDAAQQRRPQQALAAAEQPAREERGSGRPADVYPATTTAGTRQGAVAAARPAEGDNLSFTARTALKAFSDNAPSPEQRLGIELAGIDTFA